MTQKALLLSVLILGFTSILNAAIVSVKQDGTGDFTTIQEGINAAQNAYDTVLVWPGVYCENIICNNGHITVASLHITNPNNWYIQNTIIDGNQNGTCVTMNGEPSLKVIHGFTIQNGLGNMAGGIFIDDVAGVVENCIIKMNTSTNGGGGISNSYGSGTINNCIIEQNTSRYGGGISTGNGPIWLSGTTIKYNHAYGAGGGINSGYQSSVHFNSDNKCNLYLNYGSPGTDYYKYHSAYSQSIIVDTFTVSNPDHYFIGTYDAYGNPINMVSIQLDHAYLEPVDHDLYIDPVLGDDNNSGFSIDDPLKTIAYAYIVITADSANPHSIYLANGIYSPSTNDEKLPFGTKSYVSLVGESTNSTIIDADSLSHFIAGYGMKKSISIENITFQNCVNGIYIRQTECVVISDVILKNGGSYTNLEFGNIDSLVIRNTRVKNLKGGYALTINNWGEQTNFFSIENCIVENNSPGSIPAWQGQEGGGIEIKGSLSDTTFRSYGRIINTQINNNTRMPDPEIGDEMVSGLYVYGAVKLDVINSSIGNNILIGTNGTGVSSAIYADLNIYNSILFGNYQKELAVGYPNGFGYSTLRVYNSDIEGGETGIVNWGSNNTLFWDSDNIDDNPLWDTLAAIPYELPWNSPCVNKGSPMYEPGMEPPYIIQEDTIYKLITFEYDTIILPQTDISGNTRIVGGRIDMGAYEWQDTTMGVTKYKYQTTRLKVEVYPNPFYDNTFISFSLAEKANIRVIIYDLLGNEVKKLVETSLPAGNYNLIWAGNDDSGHEAIYGAYLVTIYADGIKLGSEKILKKSVR